MENKPLYQIGQEVKVFISTGYMGRYKKSRTGITKSINKCPIGNNIFSYNIETKTDTNRVSVLNRYEYEIEGVAHNPTSKFFALFGKIVKEVGETKLKDMGISSDDIDYIKLNLGVGQ